MGQPSLSIYVNELFGEYDVESVIRVGSCGGLTERVALRDLVIASGACTDSAINRIRFEGLDYAAVADFGLLRAAVDAAGVSLRDASSLSSSGQATSSTSEGSGGGVHVGLIFSSDSFYAARPELMTRMVDYGVLAVEMEACELYTLAAKYGRRALAICTVSDQIVTGEETTALERQETFGAMVEIALTAAFSPA